MRRGQLRPEGSDACAVCWHGGSVQFTANPVLLERYGDPARYEGKKVCWCDACRARYRRGAKKSNVDAVAGLLAGGRARCVRSRSGGTRACARFFTHGAILQLFPPDDASYAPS